MAGDPEATNDRNQEVKSWVEQAKKATETFWSQRANVEPKLPDGIEEVEWVVCTAGQEYVCPVDEVRLPGNVASMSAPCAEFLEHLKAEAAKLLKLTRAPLDPALLAQSSSAPSACSP